jgi:hypothetical protein
MAEIVACPSCRRQLHIPEGVLGQLVQCPDCRHQFTAAAAADSIQESKTPPVSSVPSPAPQERPRKRRYEDDDDDDYGRRRRRGRSRYDDDEDDDDDYDPRLRRRDHYEQPHRASLIMTLGILSIFVAPIILGTMAWILGNIDIRAMEEGRMDPSGMSQTKTGRTIGAVMVVLHGVLIFGVLLFIFLGALARG